MEFKRRRNIRLLQVMQQSRDIARAVSQRVKKERDHQLVNFGSKLEADFKIWQARKLHCLEQRYKECVNAVGQGHEDAKATAIQERKDVENRRRMQQQMQQSHWKQSSRREHERAERQKKAKSPDPHRTAKKIEDLRSAVVSWIGKENLKAKTVQHVKEPRWNRPNQHGKELKKSQPIPRYSRKLMVPSQEDGSREGAMYQRKLVVTRGGSRETVSSKKSKPLTEVTCSCHDTQRSSSLNLSTDQSRGQSSSDMQSGRRVRVYDHSAMHLSDYSQPSRAVERATAASSEPSAHVLAMEEESRLRDLETAKLRRTEQLVHLRRKAQEAIVMAKAENDFSHLMKTLTELDKEERQGRYIHTPHLQLSEYFVDGKARDRKEKTLVSEVERLVSNAQDQAFRDRQCVCKLHGIDKGICTCDIEDESLERSDSALLNVGSRSAEVALKDRSAAGTSHNVATVESGVQTQSDLSKSSVNQLIRQINTHRQAVRMEVSSASADENRAHDDDETLVKRRIDESPKDSARHRHGASVSHPSPKTMVIYGPKTAAPTKSILWNLSEDQHVHPGRTVDRGTSTYASESEGVENLSINGTMSDVTDELTVTVKVLDKDDLISKDESKLISSHRSKVKSRKPKAAPVKEEDEWIVWSPPKQQERREESQSSDSTEYLNLPNSVLPGDRKNIDVLAQTISKQRRDRSSSSKRTEEFTGTTEETSKKLGQIHSNPSIELLQKWIVAQSIEKLLKMSRDNIQDLSISDVSLASHASTLTSDTHHTNELDSRKRSQNGAS